MDETERRQRMNQAFREERSIYAHPMTRVIAITLDPADERERAALDAVLLELTKDMPLDEESEKLVPIHEVLAGERIELRVLVEKYAAQGFDAVFYALADHWATRASHLELLRSVGCKKLAEGLRACANDLSYVSSWFAGHERRKP